MTNVDEVKFSKAVQTAQKLEQSVGSIIHGQEMPVKKILSCLASAGHVLLEDYPGTGKTTLAKAIARSIDGADFKRLQFTPDLLPTDILGVSIFDQKTSDFRFQPGPVFTDILLADEINRASPRTQSALLEAMAEGQVTVEGCCYDLDGVFFVIATQNPVEFRGTYPLPEAQMDRFSLQCQLGYVSLEDEEKILLRQKKGHPVDRMSGVVTRDEILDLRNAVSQIRLSDELRSYIVKLVSTTRGREQVKLPASPRASIALMKVSQALSLFEGREFVTPETVQSIAEDVIAHRLVLEAEALYSGITSRSVVRDIVSELPVPA